MRMDRLPKIKVGCWYNLCPLDRETKSLGGL